MYITPDPAPEKGFFYRSDHISFAKKGVPMLYADGGVDIHDGGLEAGSKIPMTILNITIINLLMSTKTLGT